MRSVGPVGPASVYDDMIAVERIKRFVFGFFRKEKRQVTIGTNSLVGNGQKEELSNLIGK